MKAKLIHDECWNAYLWLIWPADSRQLDAFIKREFGIGGKTSRTPFLGRMVEITTDAGGEDCYIIALSEWKKTPRDYATLAHECLHVTRCILDYRGMRMSNKTDEAYCYLMDSLIRRCLKHLEK